MRFATLRLHKDGFNLQNVHLVNTRFTTDKRHAEYQQYRRNRQAFQRFVSENVDSDTRIREEPRLHSIFNVQFVFVVCVLMLVNFVSFYSEQGLVQHDQLHSLYVPLNSIYSIYLYKLLPVRSVNVSLEKYENKFLHKFKLNLVCFVLLQLRELLCNSTPKHYFDRGRFEPPRAPCKP